MQRVLITSALPYINGVKHLGNLIGSMLPADVYARFLRLRGQDVLYICATDEHGTPAELAALEAGLDVADYCSQQHDLQASIYERFHLSFDHFGRSSSPQNAALTQHFCRKLSESGFIEERIVRQVYSNADQRYLPDRYIVGTCPHCGYERARGDQCESCTRVLDPLDLIAPRSALSGSCDLEERESRHLFLRQSAFAERLRAWIDDHPEWPVLVRSIAYKWLDEGLLDRCITRDLRWGVPVDREGFEGKVFYVWFDAPISYIAATREWADRAPQSRDWKRWWQAGEGVRYVQFLAKDNVPFHTVSFPCTILGSGEEWKLADYIKGFNWLTYYGGKFSTSEKRGIFMDAALDEFPADYYRYWLLANAPESDDASFTWAAFAQAINKDLADVLGNFVNRCLRFAKSRFGERVPEGGAPGKLEDELAADLERSLASYTHCLEQLQFRRALADLRSIWTLGNAYMDRAAPWATIKTDRDAAALALRTAINLMRVIAIVSEPVIPKIAKLLADTLELGTTRRGWPDPFTRGVLEALPPGHAFRAPPILVEKIDDEVVASLIERYGGAELDPL